MHASKWEIATGPTRSGARILLESANLPTADLGDAQLDHFFFVGQATAPIALVGLELFGEHALLRSLVVTPSARAGGAGTALVDHAEDFARLQGVRELFLLDDDRRRILWPARLRPARSGQGAGIHSFNPRIRRHLSRQLRFHGETLMKRLHVHVSVADLDESVRFYSTLFAAEPTVLKDDYAKWMLEDPRVNFAISRRDRVTGIRHLGIQVEDSAELAEVFSRVEHTQRPVLNEGQTTCCYARSEKNWVEDPQGVQWETFLTSGESTVYGSGQAKHGSVPCCEPRIA